MGRIRVEDTFRFNIDQARKHRKAENKGLVCWERSLTGEKIWCVEWMIYTNTEEQEERMLLTFPLPSGTIRTVSIKMDIFWTDDKRWRYRMVCPECGDTFFTLYSPDKYGDWKCRNCHDLIYTQQAEYGRSLQHEINSLTMRELHTRMRECTDPEELIKILEIVENHLTPSSWPWHRQLVEERIAREKQEECTTFDNSQRV